MMNLRKKMRIKGEFPAGITALERIELIHCHYGINPFALAIMTQKTYKAREGKSSNGIEISPRLPTSDNGIGACLAGRSSAVSAFFPETGSTRRHGRQTSVAPPPKALE
jgi:hypothetical protein